MKRNLLNAVVLGALALPTFAMAADEVAAPAATPEHTVTSNVALVSNYLYRGISQTGASPAIQGGFDYAHASGLYAGVWGSSISWLTDSPGVTGATSSQVELDTYFGYKGTASDVGYDVGFLRYNYPATYGAIPAGSAKADTNEIYGAATYSIVTAKVSYALGDLFGVSKAKGSTYFELNAAYPVADTGVTVSGHYGMQKYKGASADALKAAASDPTYSDYKLSVAKDFSGYALGLAYSGTDANKVQYTSGTNKYLGKSTAVLSLSRSF